VYLSGVQRALYDIDLITSTLGAPPHSPSPICRYSFQSLQHQIPYTRSQVYSIAEVITGIQ